MKTCAACNGDLPPAKGSRQRLYCSVRCKSTGYRARKRGYMSLGPNKRARERLTECKRGHAMSLPEQRVFVGTLYEQCLFCYTERNRQRRKTRKSYCRKNLHLMRGDNVGYRADTDTRWCRACKRTQERVARLARKSLGYRVARCAVGGCGAKAELSPLKSEYICLRHRKPAGDIDTWWLEQERRAVRAA